MNGKAWPEEQPPSIILCLIDFSESSTRALQWAVQMADIQHAHVTVLHVFRLLKSKNGEALLMKKAKEAEANSHFVELERSLLLNKKISYDFKTEVGFINDRIDDYTSKNAIQFLVIDKSLTECNRESFDELLKNVQIPMVIIP
ncbi:MAG TPA: universal stress protein [Cyclobacteriaceae bacterium]